MEFREAIKFGVYLTISLPLMAIGATFVLIPVILACVFHNNWYLIGLITTPLGAAFFFWWIENVVHRVLDKLI